MTEQKDESIEVVKEKDGKNEDISKKRRVWELRHECEGQPFSGINLAMAVISTQSACEGLGLCPPSKSWSQLVDEYHRGYE